MATSTGGIISSAMTASPATDYAAQAQSLYQNTLGRAGDADGVNYWAGQLQSGKSLGDVQNAFTQSAKDTYQNYLTDPSVASATDPATGNLLSGDLKTGVTSGTMSGDARSVAQQALDPTIFKNLYGSTPTTATAATTAAGYTPAQLGDPTKWDITPDQTVAGQIQKIIDPNSPIIQQARAQGEMYANSRGLLNSSIGQTASDDAAYRVAIPIATSDASTYSKAAGYNADESNQFQVQNANITNQAGQFNAAQQNQLATAQLGANTQLQTSQISANASMSNAQTAAKTQTGIAALDAQTKTALANLDAGTKTQIETLDNQNKQLLQSNSSAANMFSTYMNAIANITASTTMDQAAKTTAIQNAITNMNQGLQVIQQVSGVNVSQYFAPSTFTQAEPVAATPSPAAPSVLTPDYREGS